MFAYCLNNPVNYTDTTGCLPTNEVRPVCIGDECVYAPNIEFLMAFYGVDSPSEIPEMPDGAMIFVENITSGSIKNVITFVEGSTIVFDGYKYCEYVFIGVGLGISYSSTLDGAITQGYVYGLKEVTDYCGFFLGASASMLSDVYGGAVAFPDVYAEITGGMSCGVSVGGSITYYMTGQDDWKYGRANMAVVPNPYHNTPINQSPYV